MHNIKIPGQTESLLRAIGTLGNEMNTPAYAVGGFVRDTLLNHPIAEIDFVVVGDGPSLAQRAREIFNGHGYVVYPKFGTASFFRESLKLEFVSARKESYRNHSRKPDIEKTNLKEDLTRRDFTINAMAMNLSQKKFGLIVDPFNGRKDLAKKLIRTPLEPETTFSEDPLRMMRAARFASQLLFTIQSDVLKAMSSQKKRLKIVSQERITDELLKILSHDRPSAGFHILLETGILNIIFPELTRLTGIEQRGRHHHKDVFEHTMKVLDNIANDTDNLLLRFTALVHDIGKPRVKRFVRGEGWTFHGHERIGVHMLKQIVPRLKLSNAFLKYSQKLTGLHMRPIQLIGEDVTDSAIRRLLVQAGDDIEDLMTLCRADITSGNPKRVKKHLANFDYVTRRMSEVEEKDRMRAFQSPVRGEEIMEICHLEPGPMVGQLKKRIEEAILEGQVPNDHDAAYDYLLKIKDEVMQ
ncbi:HD domain-containing protein [bacterium]|nr:HD domain-containing protein [bacterium]